MHEYIASQNSPGFQAEFDLVICIMLFKYLKGQLDATATC